MTAQISNPLDRQHLARWYADRHFRVDPEVQRIVYLPKNAPAVEIRLIEVSDHVLEIEPLEAVDFAVDIDRLDEHRLYVCDISGRQWSAVERGELALPPGWTLEGAIDLAPSDRPSTGIP